MLAIAQGGVENDQTFCHVVLPYSLKIAIIAFVDDKIAGNKKPDVGEYVGFAV
ncbi:hypothetical protein AGMMS50289_15840 [Betaproteobacteria bacterium]|nr:hypothetical protein AGMMS50289_15840 [Betaproteobacteria bacterium]